MESTTLIEAFRVDGRVAVVTGAGSGIGRGCALALAGAGATVVCADVHADTAEETAEQIRAAGGNGEGTALDVSVKREVDDLADRVAATTAVSTSGATSPGSWSRGRSSRPVRTLSTASSRST